MWTKFLKLFFPFLVQEEKTKPKSEPVKRAQLAKELEPGLNALFGKAEPVKKAAPIKKKKRGRPPKKKS